MRYPVDFIYISQKFSNSHKGIDLGWHKSPDVVIHAIEKGVVIYSKKQTTGGNVIHIKHENGFVSEYAHLRDNSIKVKVGSKVRKGQQIAMMGKTGTMTTGYHLHLGLCKGDKITYTSKDKWVNPILYLEVYPNQEVSEDTKKKYKLRYYYETGTYKLLNEKYIRTTPEIPINRSNCVKVKDIMTNKRVLLVSQYPNDYAIYKKFVILDITEIYVEPNTRVWGKTINTWVCLVNKDGAPQAKKVD